MYTFKPSSDYSAHICLMMVAAVQEAEQESRPFTHTRADLGSSGIFEPEISPAITPYKRAARSDAVAVTRIIKGMRELGWKTCRLSDGEMTRTVDSDEDAGSILADLCAADEGWLYWTKPGVAKLRFMYFVFGNEPYEVMNDCSCDNAQWTFDIERLDAAVNLEGVNA